MKSAGQQELARLGLIDALQSALAAEQAASYGYGIVGSHLAGAKFAKAAADCVAHERHRDSLVKMIFAFGGQPRAASVAYRLPIAVTGSADAVRLAVILEHQVTGAYLGLVAVEDPSFLRRFAAAAMQAAAVRAAQWNGHSQAFPGLPASALHNEPG